MELDKVLSWRRKFGAHGGTMCLLIIRFTCIGSARVSILYIFYSVLFYSV